MFQVLTLNKQMPAGMTDGLCYLKSSCMRKVQMNISHKTFHLFFYISVEVWLLMYYGGVVLMLLAVGM